MSTAETILADPVTTLEHMVREDARRQRKHGDTQYVRRVAAAFRQRTAECGCSQTCGGCRVCLAVAAALETAP